MVFIIVEIVISFFIIFVIRLVKNNYYFNKFPEFRDLESFFH